MIESTRSQIFGQYLHFLECKYSLSKEKLTEE